ncbi:hypothetical protein L0664_04780 [Octadecabacter sp. G9-8]|uniref:Uncharacterized protein n=1 Tax=Octadecabacter dasysiphoniae TaxID=2909341 RepID=A0ABS9CT66_9RHOB|nr:hypothetical protein [Octadecabacter dasysiphoniae]MCF2870373.1 hypothetical protein [Octadecabacter dasysiphoniae]
MMNSISTQQGSTLQQMGAGRPPPPPPQDGAQAGGQTDSAQGVEGGRPPPPPPPPEGAQASGQGGPQGGQSGGADPAALLQSLFDVLESEDDSGEASDILTALSANSGYQEAQSIFG